MGGWRFNVSAVKRENMVPRAERPGNNKTESQKGSETPRMIRSTVRTGLTRWDLGGENTLIRL